MPEVHLSADAEAFLDTIPTEQRQRILTRLQRLLLDPVPSDAKFMGRDLGERVFRYRVGSYRAMYKLKDYGVLIIRIGHRGNVYDRKP